MGEVQVRLGQDSRTFEFMWGREEGSGQVRSGQVRSGRDCHTPETQGFKTGSAKTIRYSRSGGADQAMTYLLFPVVTIILYTSVRAGHVIVSHGIVEYPVQVVNGINTQGMCTQSILALSTELMSVDATHCIHRSSVDSRCYR